MSAHSYFCDRFDSHFLQLLFPFCLLNVVKTTSKISFLENEIPLHHLWAVARKMKCFISNTISFVLYPSLKVLQTSKRVRLFFLILGVIRHSFEIHARVEVLVLFLILLDCVAYITSLFNIFCTTVSLSLIVQS